MQVAASLVSELSELANGNPLCSIVLSSEVARNLAPEIVNGRSGLDILVADTFGLGRQNGAVRQVMERHDSVLTVFGPLYRWRSPFRSVVGFAQPWIIYPRNECYARLPFLQRLRTRLKFKVQKAFFRRADEFIVELDHVKDGLIRELGIPPERIHIVHNCLSSIYLDETRWQPVTLPPTDGALRLGFVGRNYPHKNTAIFPGIIKALRDRHGIDARVYVTFTDMEWQACTAEFRAACVNVGALSAAQCPTFYRSLDAVVFPSLLECFSATPLEAMAMEKPLFASDRPFNREVCGGHASYFDPVAPETAADQIAEVFGRSKPNIETLRLAREHAIGFASPKERAERFLKILRAERE